MQHGSCAEAVPDVAVMTASHAFVEPECSARIPEFHPVLAASITKEALASNVPLVTYPKRLARAGIQGVVELDIEVSASAAARCIRVHTSSDAAELDAVAIAAMGGATFSPAEVAALPVDSILRHRYRFALTEPQP